MGACWFIPGAPQQLTPAVSVIQQSWMWSAGQSVSLDTPMIISTSIEIMCYVSTVEEFSMKQRISVFSIILVLLKCEADDLFSFIVIGCMCSRRLCLCVVNVCSWQLVQASSTKQYKAVQLMNDEKHSLSLCVVLSSFIRGAKLCMRWMIVLREWSVRGA